MGDDRLPLDGVEADRRQSVVGGAYRDRAADLQPPTGGFAAVGLLLLGDEKLTETELRPLGVEYLM